MSVVKNVRCVKCLRKPRATVFTLGSRYVCDREVCLRQVLVALGYAARDIPALVRRLQEVRVFDQHTA